MGGALLQIVAYGAQDIYAGVPVVIGENGVEKIIELDLSSEEKNNLLVGVTNWYSNLHRWFNMANMSPHNKK